MNKKTTIGSGIFILALILAIGFFFFADKDKTGQAPAEESNNSHKSEKIKVAACPTCFELAKNVNADKYEIIKTGSTAESIALLKNNRADIIMAGRTLKPGEPQMDSILIKEGYSFLSSREGVVYIEELKDKIVYTDLDLEKIEKAFPAQKIEQVENVYEYLDKGVVVTSWENTDYTKAAIVHVLEENGERIVLSRQPTVYCPSACKEEARELASLINR
ncbi:MAG: hypothetical protein U5L10_00380 [Candidatus Moranbacteria bacterium]|nr:hypothetical protein [Candidatus Moranbacteria bacterium]